VARRAAKAKEWKKVKKERAKLQHGKCRQGSEESDGDEEEEESDPNIPWGALAHEDEKADAGQANMTLIPQHAPTQIEEDAPPRSAGEDVPPRLEEQVRPAPTDPTGGSKRRIADMAELELSD